jgi:hypothetical protein
MDDIILKASGSAALELLILFGGFGCVVALIAVIAWCVEAWSKRK